MLYITQPSDHKHRFRVRTIIANAPINVMFGAQGYRLPPMVPEMSYPQRNSILTLRRQADSREHPPTLTRYQRGDSPNYWHAQTQAARANTPPNLILFIRNLLSNGWEAANLPPHMQHENQNYNFLRFAAFGRIRSAITVRILRQSGHRRRTATSTTPAPPLRPPAAERLAPRRQPCGESAGPSIAIMARTSARNDRWSFKWYITPAPAAAPRWYVRHPRRTRHHLPGNTRNQPDRGRGGCSG